MAAIGFQMQSVAIGWELYERTHSAFSLGLVGLAQAVPVVALTLAGGQAADLYDRRRIVIISQVVFALCAAALALLSLLHGPVQLVYAVLATAGAARAFNSPARAALLPLLVEPEIFGNVVTWSSSVFQFCAIVGPALGGLLIEVTHAAWPVYVCAAAGFLAFAFGLGGVRPRVGERRSTSASLQTLGAGVAFVRREKTILAAITLDLFAVLLGGATALLPVYARDILQVGPTGLGLLKAAPYVGALLMALTLAHRPPFRNAGPALLWSVAGFGVATIVFGLSTLFPLSLAMLALAGACDNISVVIRHILVQMRTPDEVRGRVSAVNSVFIECSNELGSFESGTVAKFFGPVVSVVSGGIGTILVVLAIAAAWPEIRRLRKL